jgi:amino acid adenylation domain-containing protein
LLQTVSVPAGDIDAAMRTAEQLAKTPISIEAAPLARALLIKLGERHHWLVTVAHHLIMDGWSYYVFIDELAIRYNDFISGSLAQAAMPASRYSDYAFYQKAEHDGADAKEHREFWRRELENVPLILELPMAASRPSEQKTRGIKVVFSWRAPFASELQEYAKSHRTTLFALILTGFAALLYRYSNQERFVIGVPSANRDDPELKHTIGIFMDMMPIALNFEDARTFEDQLQRVTKALRAASVHKALPFEQIMSIVRPPRDRSRHPIFQVMAVPQQAPLKPNAFRDLEYEILELDNGATIHDLTLGVRESVDGVTGSITFDTQLFTLEQIQRLREHLRLILESAIVNSSDPVAKLNYLASEEYERIKAGAHGIDLGAPKTLLELIAESVQLSPDAPAVVDDETTLSYSDLDKYSNQVAAGLIGFGVVNEDIVAVLMDRTVWAVVAFLAVLKAGGAYLPIDPEQPVARIRYILADAKAKLAVCAQQYKNLLDGFEGPIVEPTATMSAAITAALPRVQTTGLAYVLYTSGSTGQPKGVLVEHQSIANVLLDFKGRLNVLPGERLLAITTFAFDIAGLELFLPLASGAVCVIAHRNTVLDPHKLERMLDAQKIDLLQATPAVWQMLLDIGWTGRATLRALCGGDTLSPLLATTLCSRVAKLWNVYGPTETTVWSTAQQVLPIHGAQVSIGLPIACTECHVLDANLRPVPAGVPGELYIGGRGLARGYHGKPELTSHRFIEVDNGQLKTRLYRTGDVATRQDSGVLTFHGRMDRQLKIRGFRVEPAEIESSLLSLEGVAEGIAMLVTGKVGPRLAAFVLPRPAALLLSSDVRTSLKSLLPAHLVPELILIVDAWPLTPNLKVDHGALKKLADAAAEPKLLSVVRPADAFEQKLLELWNEVLGVSGFGVEDDFFELGGNSIMIVELFSGCASRFEKSIEIADMYSHTTIRRQASYFRGGSLPNSDLQVIEF